MRIMTVLSLVIFTIFSLPAQEDHQNVDAFVRSFHAPYTDAADLARQLSKPFRTEREKARAIYTWVARNIRYDYAKYRNPPPTVHVRGKNRQELQKNMEALHEKQIRITLQTKKGICGDYSRLMEKMCKTVGLESLIVEGLSRSMEGNMGDHAWNVLKYEGKWHLMDVTWGAGYIDDDAQRFVSAYTPAFFDTPPSLFILNHLPEESRWQLLSKPISKTAFVKQPAINFCHEDFPILAFTPANGKIVSVKGKAQIRLKLSTVPKVLVVRSGKNKQLPTEIKTGKDGWVSLSFSPGAASEISVLAGNSRKQMSVLAEFPVE